MDAPKLVAAGDLADKNCKHCEGTGEEPIKVNGRTTWPRCRCVGPEVTVADLRDLVLRDVADTLRQYGTRCMARVVEGLRTGAIAPEAWSDVTLDARAFSSKRGELGVTESVLLNLRRDTVVEAARLLADANEESIACWCINAPERFESRAA